MIDVLHVAGAGLLAVFHSSWQGAVLVAIVLLLQWGLRKRMPARWHAALWMVVLARLVIPAVPASPASLFNLPRLVAGLQADRGFPDDRLEPIPRAGDRSERHSSGASNALSQARPDQDAPLAVAAAQPAAALGSRLRWQLLVAVWLLGVLVILTHVLISICRLRAVILGCRDVVDSRIVALFARSRAEMNVSRTVRLLAFPGEISPAVTAFGWRTWVILPERMLTTLTPAELRMVFLHELAHLRRADVLQQGVWTLAVAVHWFNPLIWLARLRAQEDRELACDEAVLAAVRPNERIDYGQAILKVVELLSPVTPLPAAVGAFGCKSILQRRITMISRYHRPSRLWAPLACALLLSLGLAGLTDAVGEPKAPPAEPPKVPTGTFVVETKSATDLKPGEPAGPRSEGGKIYMHASLKVKDAAGELTYVSGILEIDPQSGQWRKLIDGGGPPRVSRRGDTMAFTNGNELWSCDTNQALSPGKLADVTGKMAWMPDGKHLVVTSALTHDNDEIDKNGWRCQTWQIAADGGSKTALAVPATDFVEDVSPDGKWFVTSSDRHPPLGRGYQLYVMRPDGSEQRRLTKGGLNVYAQFAPDSRRIVYVFQNRDGNKLKIINVDGTDERTILAETGVANSVDHAAWSPDGKRLAVIRFDWQLDAKGKRTSSLEDANYRLEIVDADGNNGRVIELKDAKPVFLGGPLDWR